MWYQKESVNWLMLSVVAFLVAGVVLVAYQLAYVFFLREVSFTEQNRAGRTPNPQTQVATAVSESPANLGLVKPLPDGPQTYLISQHESVVGPRLQQVTFDPQDPKPSELMTITADIASTPPMLKGQVRIHTDQDPTRWINLTLIEGDASEGVWTATVEVNDPHDYSFSAEFKLQNSEETWHDSLVFR